MSFAENNNGFTPSFVSLALSGVTHRFILVLECESRQYEGEVAVSHPRFCVGGPRATLDPRNVAITDLLPLGASKVDLPAGWEKVHQLLYVVQQSTDEHGWQYRSQWPQQALEATDELWSNNNATNADVRRRLWMTTVVKRDDVLCAKRKISELILSRHRGVILKGPLLRLEEDEIGDKRWISRSCSLLDEKIEITDEETGVKIDEINVLGHQIKMLDGFAFSIRKLDGSQCVLFDTDSKETRRRWLIAISYQIAVRGPLIDFAPFPYAPPLGEDISNRVILCGDLLKKGQTGMNWKSRFFKLTPRELQYYDRETLKGSIKIDGATVKTEEKSLEISLKSKSGVSVVVKSDNQTTKAVWAAAFEAQIEVLANKIASTSRVISAEEKALTYPLNGSEYAGKTVVIPSVALKELEPFNIKGGSSSESHPLSSPFNSMKGEGGHPGSQSPKSGTVGPGEAGVPMSPSGANLNSTLFARGERDSMEGGAEVLDKNGAEFFAEEDDEEEEWKRVYDDDEDERAGQNMAESSDVDGNRGPHGAAGAYSASPSKQSSADSKVYRPKSLKFGIQPEFLVSYQDFGVEPELLTTAQKVAILESAAWQNQSKALQPKEPVKTRASMISPVTSVHDPDYTPTGLRLEENQLSHTPVENDGGAVAKTTDTQKSKINAWERWSKEKGAAEKEKAGK